MFPSSLDELEAMALMSSGVVEQDVAIDDLHCKKLEEPSWIKADLQNFCDFLGVAVATLQLFTTTIEHEYHSSLLMLPQRKEPYVFNQPDEAYLRALWCQAEGFERLDPEEEMYILPTSVVELLRMADYMIEAKKSKRNMTTAIRTEYRRLYRIVQVKSMAEWIRKKNMEDYMDSI